MKDKQLKPDLAGTRHNNHKRNSLSIVITQALAALPLAHKSRAITPDKTIILLQIKPSHYNLTLKDTDTVLRHKTADMSGNHYYELNGESRRAKKEIK